jgi:hypothetical protein
MLSCPQGSALPDGCLGAPAGSAQFPHLLDTQQVIMLNIIPGSGYTNGTFNWTASGGGGSGANGTVTVSGGLLGGSNNQGYTIASQGSGYTSRPTINVSGLAGGTGGSITPTVYQATPHTASPKWNMPGVDYHVGIPSGTVLKDPTNPANLPAGAAFASSTVTVTGCNVTLDSFDFTLHNTVVVTNVSGSNCTTTIQNSLFHANGTSPFPIVSMTSLGSNGTFVMQNSEYNGLAPIGGSGSGFTINFPINPGAGTTKLLYNYFHEFDAKMIQISGGTPANQLIERFNLFSDFGNCATPPCDHGEAEYMFSGATLAFTGQFNTYILHFTTGFTDLTAPHAVQADNMAINGTTDDHNVVLMPGPQLTCGSNSNNYQATRAIYDGAQNDPSAASISNITFSQNYVDAAGGFFVWTHGAQGGATNTSTVTGNIDAGTGAACN